MKDDPHEIAEWLVHKHGLEQARAEAFTGLMKAQKKGDYYSVSVWREIRRILASRSARDSAHDKGRAS